MQKNSLPREIVKELKSFYYTKTKKSPSQAQTHCVPNKTTILNLHKQHNKNYKIQSIAEVNLDIIKTGQNSFSSIAQINTQISDLDTKIKNITQSKQYLFLGKGTNDLTQHIAALQNITRIIANSDHPEFVNIITRIEKALTPILKTANSATTQTVNSALLLLNHAKTAGFSTIALSTLTKPTATQLSMVTTTKFDKNYKQTPDYKFKLTINGKTLNLKGGGIDRHGHLIATGAFGRVFFGTDPTTGKEIAVKVLQKQPHQTIETLTKEAVLLLKMSKSENVLGAREIGVQTTKEIKENKEVQNEYMFIVMDKVDGTELFDKMIDRYNPMPLTQKISILLDVAKGLKELHDQGIVHRDLKPANILIDKTTNKAKIIDLGIASQVEAQDRACSGTPDYVAPEVLSQGIQGTSTDIYSMGLLVHELLTGKILERPVESRGQPPSQERIKHDLTVSANDYIKVSSDPAVREQLAALVNSCLKLNPNDRVSTKILIENLETISNLINPKK